MSAGRPIVRGSVLLSYGLDPLFSTGYLNSPSESFNTALRLERYFGTPPQVCLNLQKTWELRRKEF